MLCDAIIRVLVRCVYNPVDVSVFARLWTTTNCTVLCCTTTVSRDLGFGRRKATRPPGWCANRLSFTT